MIRKFLQLPTMMKATYVAEAVIITTALVVMTVSMILILLLAA